MSKQMTAASVTVSAQGTADAKFTSVKYSAQVSTNGRSGPEAKELAKLIIAKIKAVIEKFADEAGIDRQRVKIEFSIGKQTRYEHGNHVFVGYQATCSIGFTGTNVNLATKLHDALTSIDGAEADSPQFCVDKSEALERQAFQDAVSKARSRLEYQCRALGLDPNDFEVGTWSMGNDGGYRGKTLAMAAMADESGGDVPVELEAGKAEHMVSVNVTYVRKSTADNGAGKPAGKPSSLASTGPR